MRIKHIKRWVGLFAIIAFMTTLAFSAEDQVRNTTDTVSAGSDLEPPSYGLLSAVGFKQLAQGHLGSIALSKAGDVWVWGFNNNGFLGIGGSKTYAGGMVRIPSESFGNKEIVKVGAGMYNASALDSDGHVWVWGRNLSNIANIGGPTNTSGNLQSPAKVGGLLDSVNIVDMVMSFGDESTTFMAALSDEGKVYTWGQNAYGQLGNGSMSTTNTVVKADIPDDVVITQITVGGSHTAALDSDGNVWTWGRREHGEIGAGTTGGYQTTPAKVPTLSNVKQISSTFFRSTVLKEDGTVWQWGAVANSAAGVRYVSTPEKVNIKDSEITRVGYTPIVQSVTTTERVAYFIDQHGRVWAWGGNNYYGLGIVKSPMKGDTTGVPPISGAEAYSAEAIQSLNTIGDGDTGRTIDLNQPNVGLNNVYGQQKKWGLVDGLHPTVYDEKYKDEHWAKLGLKEFPKVAVISGARSGATAIDVDGNIWKWAVDGSGTIAWGWDYLNPSSDATASGNVAGGLYNMYSYEPQFLRGSPNIDAVQMSLKDPENKMYHSSGSKDDVSLDVTIPKTVENSNMNFTLKAYLKDLRYVVMPYDPSDANFSIDLPTEEQFEAAYLNSLYDKGDLLNGVELSSIDVDKIYNYTIEIADNSVVWVYSKDQAGDRIETSVIAKKYTNFYTDITIQHKGEKFGTPTEEIYEKTTDNVNKNSNLIANENPDIYGLPLDKNKNVIVAPIFGYDKVKVSWYDPNNPQPSDAATKEKIADIYKYWQWHEPQDKEIQLILDTDTYLEEAKKIYTFYYDINPSGWVTVDYEGIEKSTGASIPGFSMASETVKIDKPLTKVPPEIASYTVVGYQVDGSPLSNLVNGQATFTPVGPTKVIFVYQLPVVHVRQVILNPNSSVVLPTNGYLRLLNVKQSDWTTIDSENNVITNSGLDTNTVDFMKYEVTVKADATGYFVKWVTPQYYEYAGHIVSKIDGNHDATKRSTTGEIRLDFDTGSEYWVTLYLHPSKDNTASHGWGDRINNFGNIKMN